MLFIPCRVQGGHFPQSTHIKESKAREFMHWNLHKPTYLVHSYTYMLHNCLAWATLWNMSHYACVGLLGGLWWCLVWGGSPYSILSNIQFTMHRALGWVPKKMWSVTQHHIFSDNWKTGHKIQELSINIVQHLLNTPDSIFWHSTERLKVRIIPSGSICIRDQKKGQTVSSA